MVYDSEQTNSLTNKQFQASNIKRFGTAIVKIIIDQSEEMVEGGEADCWHGTYNRLR
jgi:basic membrane lipoprotein Med (substrate-binding protein (PBP1-ABC) superfamily)